MNTNIAKVYLNGDRTKKKTIKPFISRGSNNTIQIMMVAPFSIMNSHYINFKLTNTILVPTRYMSLIGNENSDDTDNEDWGVWIYTVSNKILAAAADQRENILSISFSEYKLTTEDSEYEFIGFQSSEAALESNFPSPVNGQYAGVGDGTTLGTATAYIANDGAWVNQNITVLQYESNLDILRETFIGESDTIELTVSPNISTIVDETDNTNLDIAFKNISTLSGRVLDLETFAESVPEDYYNKDESDVRFLNRDGSEPMDGPLNMDQHLIDNITSIALYNEDGNAVAHYDGRHIVWDFQGVNAEMFLNLFVEVKTDEENITHGDVLMFTGQVGASGRCLVKKATREVLNENPSLFAGVATVDVPLSGTNTLINWYGAVNDVDTSDFTQGDEIYYDSREGITAGSWTDVKPDAPDVQILIGVVSIVHTTQGQIKIRPDLGRSLGNLHDVHFNDHVFQDDDILVYDLINQRWEVKTKEQYLSDVFDSFLKRDGSNDMTGDLNLNEHEVNDATKINFNNGAGIGTNSSFGYFGNGLIINHPDFIGIRINEKNVLDIIEDQVQITNGSEYALNMMWCGIDEIYRLRGYDTDPIGVMSTFDMKLNNIINLADPVDPLDVAHKKYVDEKTVSEITAHDDSETSHLYIRQLIEENDREIARIDARGRSYGEVPYTTAEMQAFTPQERYDNIQLYIESQDWFDGETFTPIQNELVYDTGVGDGVDYHEWEYNGTAWVDNGAINSPKAGNDIFGSVKGGNSYVSIVAGIMEILKANYATALGDSDDNYDYASLTAILESINTSLDNRYTESEVDQLISQLVNTNGMKESQILKSTDPDVEVFDNGDDIDYDTYFKPDGVYYNTVLIRIFNGENNRQNVRYTEFKPAEGQDGNRLRKQIQNNPVRYFQMQKTNGDLEIRVVAEDGTEHLSHNMEVKFWGIKLDEWTADDISYETGTVKDALDEAMVTSRENHYRIATVEETLRKVSSSDVKNTESGEEVINLPIDVANGQMKPTINGMTLEAKQLVTNGDFEDGTNNWFTLSGRTLSIVDGELRVTRETQQPYFSQYLGDNVFVDLNEYVLSFEIKGNISGTLSVALAVGTDDDVTSTTDEKELEITTTLTRYNVTLTADSDVTNIRFNFIDGNTSGDYIHVDNVFLTNKTTLIDNKQYSPLYDTTFDLMSESEIETQINAWVENGALPNDNIQSVSGNKRLKSVGKNLFDITQEYIKGRFFSDENVVDTNRTDNIYRDGDTLFVEINELNAGTVTDDYIDLQKNTIYTISIDTASTCNRIYINFYDNNNDYIKTEDFVNDYTFTFDTENATKIRISFWRGGSLESPFTVIKPQLEQGSTATDYEEYVSHEMYLQPNRQLYGYETYDKIVIRNGKAYGQYNYDESGVELAEPIEEEITSRGQLIGHSKGTVYVDSNIIAPQATEYTTSAVIDNSDYPIETLDTIIKLNADGSQTELDTEDATIAGDGLSFTHTELSSGDLVLFTYFYDNPNSVVGLTDIEYYDNRYVYPNQDSTKFYKKVETVDDSGAEPVSVVTFEEVE